MTQMKSKTQAIRHGDLTLVHGATLPAGLEPASTQTLMQGANGNNHDVKNGTVYLKDVGQFIFGYLVAHDDCTLLHPDHGEGADSIKTAAIPPGVYELRRQFEHKHEGMTPVLD